ncbi:MAG TPA: GMC family oxidoreductase N-terminal domain-containing protein, partial [Dehalococcoidia bacterium]|nr:GMC family oxidoreductase N-terminal domain-containing protein [Dehalococcoidia bacterium]
MPNEPVGVLVIGAGASGAAFAWSIADIGTSVLCLDQGPWMKQADYPSNGLDWESRGMGDFSPSPNVRRLPTDYPVNEQDSEISPLMFNAIGGSTIMWAAHFPRLTPGDFRTKSEDGVGEDWPIDYETLDPFFAINDRMMGVSGLSGDPAYPYHEPPLPPLPLGETGNALATGFEKLGWHWWPSDSAILSREYEGRSPCINLGPCMTGCTQGAKASTDITYWPAAQRKGVQVRAGCRVREITVRADGMADGVLYYDEEGQLQVQKAEIVVLACNGIGTPRLLLSSKSKQHPDGLANSSGLVGKNLMFHPYTAVTGIFERPLNGRGPVGCSLWSHEFYRTDLSRGFVRGYSFEAIRGFGPVQTALWGMVQGLVPWGQDHHQEFARLYDHTATLVGITEDLAEETNTVTLDPELTDSHGIPAPKITYRLSENSRKMLAHAVDRASDVLAAAG